MDCPTCGKPMLPNLQGAVGDPAEVCPVDDKAHNDAARAVAAERAALLKASADAAKVAPSPAQLAAIGAKSRPEEVTK